MKKISGSPCIATLLMGLPVLAMTACSSPQHASTQPGTTPPVKSAAPTSSGATTTPAPGGGALTAELKTPDGRSVATATFDFTGGYVTVTVKTVANGVLTPGLHGLHVHEIGKCEPNSVAPTGGAPGNFLSAGGHYQAPATPASRKAAIWPRCRCARTARPIWSPLPMRSPATSCWPVTRLR